MLGLGTGQLVIVCQKDLMISSVWCVSENRLCTALNILVGKYFYIAHVGDIVSIYQGKVKFCLLHYVELKVKYIEAFSAVLNGI
jgi:hypothetical protein